MLASSENLPLLAELLAEQGRLDTPVARFSHASPDGFAGQAAAQFSTLIPLSLPKAGEQYGFQVDLDSCSGCKACVAACHSLNGLDDDETWRDVGLLTGGDHRSPFQQTITTACHHCEDPACLNGCPVLAYEKDPVTGIVRHLDDQCIGCQYCIMKCPYDAPKYSSRLGIVRKCDMCHGRLSAGEAPACVQACPTHAIRIEIVSVSKSREEPGPFLAGAPEPSYTRPTTSYVTGRRLPANLAPGDGGALVAQPPHWPLAVMLTLMPAAVGCSVAAAVFPATGAFSGIFGWTALAAGAVGLAASVLHLGQPLRAWRIFLGWRASWLSREAIVFGCWLAFAGLSRLSRPAGVAAAIVGVTGLFCSAMIYADTRRQFWRLWETAAGLVSASLVLTAAVAFAAKPSAAPAAALGIGTMIGVGLQLRRLKPLDQHDSDAQGIPALTSARLLWGPLRSILVMRLLLGVCGGIALPFLVMLGGWPTWWCFAVPGLCGGAELLRRSLFFRAVDAPKMPGMPG